MPTPVQLDADEAARSLSGEGDRGLPRFGKGPPLPSATRRPVHEAVAEFARTAPDRTAVRAGADGADTVTYRELLAWADRIAALLAERGVGRGDHVAVLVEPSTAMVAAALGVLRAGAAYVPVDLANPDPRIHQVLSDAGTVAAVVGPAARTRTAALPCPAVPVEADASPNGALVDATAVNPDDPAYLIYTSGSTGTPKGVVVEHGQLAASTLARHAVYPDPAVFLLVSPLAFDSSVAGLWGTLTAGGCLVVASAEDVRDAERLAGLIERHGVTRLLCVPSLYDFVLDAAERLGVQRLDTLETVIVAGEPLPSRLLERHFGLLPSGVSLVNEYGPTEATVWASYRRFDRVGPVSVGGPVPGTDLYVLDGDLRPVPAGVQGELFIAGAGVARGYHGLPDATAGCFLPDPFAGSDRHARMYRTGDLARWNDDGTLELVGRRDHQIKIRGHRVELGAVESALRALPGIGDAVVVFDSVRSRLDAFVVPLQDAEAHRVRERLAETLPPVMVPTTVRALTRFPVNVNGKVDREALTRLAATPDTASGPKAAVRAPSDDVLAQIVGAWCEVLRVEDVPVNVNFFDAGGNSLTTFKLQNALERRTGKRPSVVALFRHTTVTAQAELIRTREGAEDDEAQMHDISALRAQALRARRERAQRRTG